MSVAKPGSFDPQLATLVAEPPQGDEWLHEIKFDGYRRNNRTNTSIAAYATRATPGAPVSVPLRWEELSARVRPSAFTVSTVPRRLARLRADPWKGYAAVRQRIGAATWETLERIGNSRRAKKSRR